MWLLPLGSTASQTQPVCVSLCVFLYVNNTWSEIIQNYFAHYANHESDCQDSEKIIGAADFTAMVCSCGIQTPIHLTLLPSVMSMLPVCMSSSWDGWALLATSVTTLQTPRLFSYVRKYIIYIHLKKEKEPNCAVWTNSTLTSVDKCVYWMRSSAKSF